MRINKYLSLCQQGSRRKVEEYITQGKVSINGKKVVSLSTQVDEENDIVMINGNVVQPEKEKVYVILNKPRGFITSLKDEKKRPVVTDLLPNYGVQVYPVGRLDYNSEGLLLLTNDGTFTNSVIHPKNKIEKEYEVTFSGDLTQEKLTKLKKPFYLDGYRTTPAKITRVRKINNKKSSISIVIYEGRNRQIRKMFASLDLKVITLKRIRIGNLHLSGLKTGRYKLLSKNDINKVLEK